MSAQISGFCTLCRSRCGTLNTVRGDSLVRVQADPRHPTGSATCPKGRAAPELVHSPHRILHPMRRTAPKGAADPGWQRISWDEALDEIAARFGKIREESGAEAVAFGVTTPSGTPLSDSIDWIERFVRAFGSPNIAYGTEVCNWHKDHAHAFTFGCGIPVADYANADLIMLWGHNPTNTWLAQANAIGEGRRAGARLLVIDPQRTALAAQADAWLPVRPGTDAALALGLAHQLLSTGRYNRAFVRDWTNAPLLVRADTGRLVRAGDIWPHGPTPQAWVAWNLDGQAPAPYDTEYSAGTQGAGSFALEGEYIVEIDGQPVRCHTVLQALAQRCAQYTPAHVEAVTGVTAASLLAAADLIAQSPAIAYHSWSGVAQSTNATQTDRAIAVLYALTGCFDTPGANRLYPKPATNPVNGLDLIPAAQRAKALGLPQRPLGPAAMGWVIARDLYQAILTGEPYRVRAFMGFGTNQLASQADVEMAQAALRELEFHVHCDLFETPTARYADILLPVNTPWEREGLRIGFEITHAAQERVQLRPRMVTPRGESRSDNDIVFSLACRLGMQSMFFDGELDRAWNHQLAPLGITVADLRGSPDGSLRVPMVHHDRKYGRPRAGASDDAHGSPVTGFDTQTRRVELYSELLLRHGYDPLPAHDNLLAAAGEDRAAYPLTITSRKNGNFCHSQHRALPSLRKRSRQPQAVLNPQLAAEKGIEAGDWVRVTTPAGSARFVAEVDPYLSKDVVYAEVGWWQACPELGEPGYDVRGDDNSNYNGLISAQRVDPISGSVPMRQFPCNIERDAAFDVTQRRWAGQRQFAVAAANRVADGVLELALAPQDGGALPDYRPGQHITIEVPTENGGALQRSYSLIGPARLRSRREYRIAVRHQRGRDGTGQAWEGAMSGFLHAHARAGMRIGVSAPAGTFILPEQSPQPVVLFAGGIGITPFLSYLESLLDAQDPPAVWLHYANRSACTKAYDARLRELGAQLPGLTIRDYFGQPGDGGDPALLLGAHVVSDALIAARARFYMCGPPAMMDSLREGLCARGVPAFDIFSEIFRSPSAVDADDAARHRVRFSRSGDIQADWTADRGTLLGFGESLGLTMPSGCRVGQCESCAVTIVSGQVRHLHGEEPEDATVCLTCQAVPASDLVLDI
ncbi:ferredoxin:oxidoreductase FAD/NAD(P)-binding protein [Bordetella genomosp. 7]|uniref:molybdopterin-dependent oxidoreductase n=1 Tax=Bordetella genomosp. 7 TaxID=1416805 RepID=UPI000B9DD8BE|nr:molybdopterin-dependent oxidoreductase [Bordetella genomosp. 7]OZI27109.1 ferredoxin:oxidoreductase FAD/NAD(P)-binding protein [Bordetella genomosp. 7]